jgi:hypothetical protein
LGLGNRRDLGADHGAPLLIIKGDEGDVVGNREGLAKDRLIDTRTHKRVGGEDGGRAVGATQYISGGSSHRPVRVIRADNQAGIEGDAVFSEGLEIAEET